MNTDRNEKINAKWKLRHEEKVSDKASVEFKAPFEEKEIQLPRLKFLRMIICHKLHPLSTSFQKIQVRQHLMNIQMYLVSSGMCKII